MDTATPAERSSRGRLPAWLLGLIPLLLIGAAVGAFALLDGPGLGERPGPPVEELTVERTELHPGEIELTIRNDGPDPVSIEQLAINDGFVDFEIDDREIGRLESGTVTIPYPWIEGEAYEIFAMLSTGGTVEHEIEVAVETPEADLDFYGLMALIGLYVGIIPVSIGMIWLPFVRRVGTAWIRALIAFTIGLLAFLAIDSALEGLEIAEAGPEAFGGASLVILGGLIAYLALSGIDSHLRSRQKRAAGQGAAGTYLALLVAIGIGLHNLGEGLAIGSAYAAGAIALGAFLIVGFALHNTTEGLAIVAPLAGSRPSLVRLAGYGLIAGAPVIPGAWIGASAFNPSVVALLLGVGVGAIIQVIEQLAPSIRDAEGRSLNALAASGLLAGLAVMYLTGLLVAI